MHIKTLWDENGNWATVQLDFHMPQAFDLKYVNEKGEFEKTGHDSSGNFWKLLKIYRNF